MLFFLYKVRTIVTETSFTIDELEELYALFKVSFKENSCTFRGVKEFAFFFFFVIFGCAGSSSLCGLCFSCGGGGYSLVGVYGLSLRWPLS